MDLTNEDVADILALLDSLPYDELDLETPRFRLTLRRTPAGWTQSTQILSAPEAINGGRGPLAPPIGAGGPRTPTNDAGGGASEGGGTNVADGEPGTAEPGLVADGEPGTAEPGLVADGEPGTAEPGLVAVRAPLPGTFYRAPRPGAAPFAEVGSRVGADTVIGIVETMKLMNPVHAGVAGVVAEFCVGNAEPTAHGATLLRIRADR